MTSTNMTFSSLEAHRAWLAHSAALPRGFRAGTARFEFLPKELPKPAKMCLTLLAADAPTPSFAAVFTRNAFPGAPIIIGRRRLLEPRLGAIIINNKVANVCAPNGIEAAERISAATAHALGIQPSEVLPASTGVIGWELPVGAMIEQVGAVVRALQPDSILPAAEGICTTDLYPKVRRASVGRGSIVGIAKGAGMIEPNLATMLVWLLTDLEVSREELRAALSEAVEETFHAMTIDGDTSTSDTVAFWASNQVPSPGPAELRIALTRVCADLAEDIVRNGEGVHHVIRVRVSGAPSDAFARSVAKTVVRSPLFQCAVAGNDPNVGRLVSAIGKDPAVLESRLDLSGVRLFMGDIEIMSGGTFRLTPAVERELVAHLKAAELYASVPPPDGLTFQPPIRFPPHERAVEIRVELGLGTGQAVVLGADRTHEYISENADYRT